MRRPLTCLCPRLLPPTPCPSWWSTCPWTRSIVEQDVPCHWARLERGGCHLKGFILQRIQLVILSSRCASALLCSGALYGGKREIKIRVPHPQFSRLSQPFSRNVASGLYLPNAFLAGTECKTTGMTGLASADAQPTNPHKKNYLAIVAS